MFQNVCDKSHPYASKYVTGRDETVIILGQLYIRRREKQSPYGVRKRIREGSYTGSHLFTVKGNNYCREKG